MDLYSAIAHSCLSGCSDDFCLLLLERKEEFEAGAGTPVVCRRVKVQSTTMPSNDFCTDREPEPRTVATLCRKERFQNLLLSFCWNSRTCVRDLYIETVHRSSGGKKQGSPFGIESIALLIRFARTCLISPSRQTTGGTLSSHCRSMVMSEAGPTLIRRVLESKQEPENSAADRISFRAR
jgi:hypothetical protein